jgi:AcrR family transcriptional regulator
MAHIAMPGSGDEDESAAAPRLSAGWEARRRRVSGHIEAAALRLFADRGYAEVTVEDVAAVADCSIRTVTRHFPTKEDLLLDFHRRKNQKLLETFTAFGPTRDPAAAIWKAWRELAKRSAAEFPAYSLWRAAAATAPEVMNRVDGERRRTLQKALTAIIASALDSDPDQDVRPGIIAATIESANTAVVDFWLRRGCVDDLDALYRMAETEVAPHLWTTNAHKDATHE